MEWTRITKENVPIGINLIICKKRPSDCSWEPDNWVFSIGKIHRLHDKDKRFNPDYYCLLGENDEEEEINEDSFYCFLKSPLGDDLTVYYTKRNYQ